MGTQTEKLGCSVPLPCVFRAVLESSLTSLPRSPVNVQYHPDAQANRLLTALPPADWRRLAPQLERIDLPLGSVICEPGEAIGHVYFPTTAVVSLHSRLTDDTTPAVAMIGNTGVVGVSLFMGGRSAPSRAVVQHPGQGYRLNAGTVMGAFNQSAPVTHLLLLYTQAMITEMAQTTFCLIRHSPTQQLSRLMLRAADCSASSGFALTPQVCADMLGIPAEEVTHAALELQQRGLIGGVPGRLGVLDRPGLESCACACYAIVRMEYERLLAPVAGQATHVAPPPATAQDRERHANEAHGAKDAGGDCPMAYGKETSGKRPRPDV